MSKPIEIHGQLTLERVPLALAVSRYNDFITSRLVSGAMDAIERHGGSAEDVTCVYVPGAFELPLVAKKLAEQKKFAAVVCLGCVIRGHTPHFDFIANEATKGIAQTSLDTGMPIAFGVITADTLEQAIERAGSKAGNKGAEAALTAIEMINVYRQIEKL
jgi:6,7-dimethyl-8-ribityllumazine synthase